MVRGSVTTVVDIDAAIGYVVAHGDPVERARLSYLRNGQPVADEVVDRIASGQMPEGGWPASAEGAVPSIDATCFRLHELDDLGGLRGPVVERALTWLAGAQRGAVRNTKQIRLGQGISQKRLQPRTGGREAGPDARGEQHTRNANI